MQLISGRKEGTTGDQIPLAVASNGRVVMAGYDAADDMLRVKSVQKKFRDSFNSLLAFSNNWDWAEGTGAAINLTGDKLNILSGTTPNAESWVMSKETFSIPFRLQFGLMMTQRIVNQTFYVEVVSVSPNTGLPDGQHVAAYMFDGAASTMAKYRVGCNGGAPLDSVASTVPNTGAVVLFEIEPYTDETWFHAGAVDSANSRSNSYRRHLNIPDPNAVYKVRFRFGNSASAPASSTTASISFVSVQDYAELTAEITAGRGQSAAGQGLGVNILGIPTVFTNENALTLPNQSSIVTMASTNAAAVKSSAGTVFSLDISNTSASPIYLKLYNKTTAPVIGTDTPVMIIDCPANSFRQYELGRVGRRFSSGIAVAVTGGQATADTTATAAGCLAGITYL